MLVCSWLADMRIYEVEDQSLKVKEEDDSNILLEDDSYGCGCWWLI